MPDQERDERRLRKRYPVSAVVRFRWQDSTGNWISDSGTTLNMSVAGIYIITPSSPPMGAPVEVRVAISTKALRTARACLVGKGVVTRVNSQAGFAAQINLRMLRVHRSGSNVQE